MLSQLLRTGLPRVLLTAHLVLILQIPMSAEAGPPVKAATSMAKLAATAFEAGDLARAAQFYLQAFRQDPSQTDYLYGAARAEQMLGKNDQAEQHYREFLAASGTNPARAEKARAYLRELAGVRADTKAHDAERMAAKGDFALAAAAWLDAWHIAPDRTQFLFRAGRAEHEAGEDTAAREHLGAFLRDAPADAADRSEAKALLDRIYAPKPAQATVQKPAPVEEPAAKPTQIVVKVEVQQPTQPVLPTSPVVAPSLPVVERAAPEPDTSMAKWVFGTGAAATVAGLGILVWGLFEAADFDKRLSYDGTTVNGTMSYDQAEAEYKSIRNHQIIGGVLAGAGAIAVGVGTKLLWWPSAKQLTVSPSGQGFAVSGRF